MNTLGLWQTNKFEHLLPQEVVMEIVDVLVDPGSGKDVSVCWEGTSNGTFTTKSVYELISAMGSDTSPDRLWEVIWKWSGIERVRNFLWQVARDGLLTNGYPFSYHMGLSSFCPLCGLHEET